MDTAKPGNTTTQSGQSGSTDQPQGRTNKPSTPQSIHATQGSRGAGDMTTERQRDVPMTREGRQGTPLTRPGTTSPGLFSTPPGALAGAFMANPFEFMRRISSEMDSWFDNTIGQTMQPRASSGRLTRTDWMPQIETIRRGNDLVVRADVPGMQKENLDVHIEDGALVVSGERKQETEEEGQGGEYRSERSYGSFYRAIPLPDGVSDDKIAATYRDGVLEVTVPMPTQQEQSRGRKIDIR